MSYPSYKNRKPTHTQGTESNKTQEACKWKQNMDSKEFTYFVGKLGPHEFNFYNSD